MCKPQTRHFSIMTSNRFDELDGCWVSFSHDDAGSTSVNTPLTTANENPDQNPDSPDDPKHPGHLLGYARFFRVVRPLAYSNEVGEAFRHRFPQLLPWAYKLTGIYVFGDVARQV